MCGDSVSKTLLAEAHSYPYWNRKDGACPACIQQNLLQTSLAKGDAALHEAIQTAIACMLEANPALPPLLIRNVLKDTAHFIPGADRQRQGAGAVAPGQAVARALAERHSWASRLQVSPHLSPEGIRFSLHDHAATSVQVLGSWDGWRSPGIVSALIEPGFWQTQPMHFPVGQHAYKFLIDGTRWLDDPDNPRKAPDGVGGLNSTIVVPEAGLTRVSEGVN